MDHTEPLSTLQEVKIAWINLADCYKTAGQQEMAFEILKELVSYSDRHVGIETLRALYDQHLSNWQRTTALYKNIA